jgi:hypothetical protein
MRSEYYVLIDDAGTWWDVDLDPGASEGIGSALALDRQRVSLRGERVTPRSLGEPVPRLRVSSIGVERAHGARTSVSLDARAVSGSRPYLTILCRFADAATVIPATKEQMQTVMGPVYPGMDHFYREMSMDQVNLAGSVVLGWYTLPRPRSYYIASGGANLDLLSQDCTEAADPEVNFPDFAGINLQFNQRLDCCSWGGSRALRRDGVTKVYPMTWMADWAIGHSVYGHEIGHSFGWPHSHGAYGAQYDSKWDIMSSSYNYRDATVGWLGVHTIAHHKDRAGWIPAARKFVAPVSGSSTILLERGAQPGAGSSYLVAQVAIPGTSSYYTIEARRFAGGYDLRLPAEAVVLHRTNGFEAEVVDVDFNDDPNDAAAQWLPGETFVDPVAGIAISVDALVGDAYRVTIRVGTDLPLSLSLGSRSRRDSSVALSTSLMHDSVALTFSGSGATSATWSASSRSSWLSVVPASGVGSGRIRWTRDAGKLASGTYVDTISVTVPGAIGSPAMVVDTLRILPPPSVESAAAELLGAARLSDFEKKYLDQEGNRDAKYNLGDFLAFLDRSGLNPGAEMLARLLTARTER